ncbi:MAG: methylated-DNA--[protein]-cysteine S-methyltransferase [Ginsengibacter sp.]
MVYRSSLGFIKINISNGFINEVSFIKNGKEPEQLTDTNTLPAANKKMLQKCKQQLDEYFSGKRKIFDLPIYQEGTGFQQKVWQELIQIPYGKTITYLQLAQRIGNVKAIRAAAAANGRNRLWIIVPCHRVIGSNRGLTGYAGGLPMKKWLLEHENKYANGVSLLF